MHFLNINLFQVVWLALHICLGLWVWAFRSFASRYLKKRTRSVIHFMHCTHCFRTRTNALEDLCEDCSRYYKTTKSRNNTLNFQAVQRHHESCVRKLLEAGADVNFINLDRNKVCCNTWIHFWVLVFDICFFGTLIPDFNQIFWEDMRMA